MQTRPSSSVLTFLLAVLVLLPDSVSIASSADDTISAPAATADFEIRSASVRHLADLDLFVFEQQVAGQAGSTTPVPRGQMHRAPVLAYVFPTTLTPDAVGFEPIDGILALAVTSHPDFDDTPLWDEDGDRDTGNDGIVYHTHWVVLVEDARVPGGLAVKETPADITDAARAALLPATSPNMPIYLDSPGFAVRAEGSSLKVLVPGDRIRLDDRTGFRYDAVTAYLEVNLEDAARPTLGVYEVYDVLSEKLTLPYRVEAAAP